MRGGPWGRGGCTSPSPLPTPHAGSRNHLVFLGYLLTLQWLLIWGIATCVRVMMQQCHPEEEQSFWSRLDMYMRCDPWMSWVFFNCALHFMWVHLLFASQCIQVGAGGGAGMVCGVMICQNMFGADLCSGQHDK